MTIEQQNPQPEHQTTPTPNERSTQLFLGLVNDRSKLSSTEQWIAAVNERTERLDRTDYRSTTSIGEIISTVPESYLDSLAKVGSFIGTDRPEVISAASQRLHGGQSAKSARALVNALRESESFPVEDIPSISQLWKAYETSYDRLDAPIREVVTVLATKADGTNDPFAAFHNTIQTIADNSPTSYEFDILAGMLFKRMAHVMDNPKVIESFLQTSLGKQSPTKNHDGTTVAIMAIECERNFSNNLDLLGLVGKMGWAFEDHFGTSNSVPLQTLLKSFSVIKNQKEHLMQANADYAQSEIGYMRQFILTTLETTRSTITALHETLGQLEETGIQPDDIALRTQQSIEVIEAIKASGKRILGPRLRDASPEIQALLKPTTSTPLIDILQKVQAHSQPEIAPADATAQIDEIRSKFTLSAKKLRSAQSYQQVSDNLRNGITEGNKKLLPKIDSAYAMEITKFLIKIEQRLTSEDASAVFSELDSEALREIELLAQNQQSKKSHSATNQPILNARREWLLEHAGSLTSNHFPASIQNIGRQFLQYEQDKAAATQADS